MGRGKCWIVASQRKVSDWKSPLFSACGLNFPRFPYFFQLEECWTTISVIPIQPFFSCKSIIPFYFTCLSVSFILTLFCNFYNRSPPIWKLIGLPTLIALILDSFMFISYRFFYWAYFNDFDTFSFISLIKFPVGWWSVSSYSWKKIYLV